MNHTANELDQMATGLASDLLRAEAKLLPVLMDMKRLRVFAVLNYQGVFDYCVRKLRFSSAQAFYYKSVAEKAVEVPELKDSVVQGEFTRSQARRILPVVNQANHKEWIEKAKSLPQKKLEREVMMHNPNAQVHEKLRPVSAELAELRVPVDQKTEENLERLKDVLSQKLGRAASLAEVVAWAVEVTREKCDPERKAQRSRAASVSLGKSSAKPGRQPVRASVKHSVVIRDKDRCVYTSPDDRRCEQRRWLELHHVVPVKDGGLNTPENLVTLCQAHHDLQHSSS